MGRKLKQPLNASDVAAAIGSKLLRSENVTIHEVGAVSDVGFGILSFAKNELWVNRADSKCILIVDTQYAQFHTGPTLISSSARLDFARAIAYLERKVGFTWDTSEAKVHETVRIARNVVLGNGVEVGEGSVIHHNVVIGDEVKIGKRCVIKSGAVIGEDGFGFERDLSGAAVRLPHLGGVVIGDDVEIGSLTTVCRGTLNNTIICDGVKIDDHVHIAHNVFIDKHAFVIACAEVSGGVKIGARAWIAPHACIMNQLTIGADAVIGLGGVVVKSVPDGVVVIGNPAKPLLKNTK